MSRITIHAYAALGDLLGARKIEISTPAKTLKELIDWISERYSPSFKNKLIDPKSNELQSIYRILVNGQDVEYLNKLETRIREGDKIFFFPPVSGG